MTSLNQIIFVDLFHFFFDSNDINLFLHAVKNKKLNIWLVHELIYVLLIWKTNKEFILPFATSSRWENISEFSFWKMFDFFLIETIKIDFDIFFLDLLATSFNKKIWKESFDNAKKSRILKRFLNDLIILHDKYSQFSIHDEKISSIYICNCHIFWNHLSFVMIILIIAFLLIYFHMC